MANGNPILDASNMIGFTDPDNTGESGDSNSIWNQAVDVPTTLPSGYQLNTYSSPGSSSIGPFNFGTQHHPGFNFIDFMDAKQRAKLSGKRTRPGEGYRDPSTASLDNPLGEWVWPDYDEFPEDITWEDLTIEDGRIMDKERKKLSKDGWLPERYQERRIYGPANAEFNKARKEYFDTKNEYERELSKQRKAEREANKGWLDPSGDKYGPFEGLLKLPFRAASDVLGVTGDTGELMANTLTGGNLPDWAKKTVNLGTQIGLTGGASLFNPRNYKNAYSTIRNMIRPKSSLRFADDLAIQGPSGTYGSRLHFPQLHDDYLNLARSQGNVMAKSYPKRWKAFQNAIKSFKMPRPFAKIGDATGIKPIRSLTSKIPENIRRPWNRYENFHLANTMVGDLSEQFGEHRIGIPGTEWLPSLKSEAWNAPFSGYMAWANPDMPYTFSYPLFNKALGITNPKEDPYAGISNFMDWRDLGGIDYFHESPREKYYKSLDNMFKTTDQYEGTPGGLEDYEEDVENAKRWKEEQENEIKELFEEFDF